MNHRLAKTVFNLWPPFWGAGIKVARIAPDWKQVEVRLRLGLTNRNYVGVHFGGSLYAMTDPRPFPAARQLAGRSPPRHRQRRQIPARAGSGRSR